MLLGVPFARFAPSMYDEEFVPRGEERGHDGGWRHCTQVWILLGSDLTLLGGRQWLRQFDAIDPHVAYGLRC